MKANIKAYRFTAAVIIYLLAVFTLLALIFVSAWSKPKQTFTSSVPELSLQAMGKTSASLSAKYLINYPGKQDLSGFTFGKSEPFR